MNSRLIKSINYLTVSVSTAVFVFLFALLYDTVSSSFSSKVGIGEATIVLSCIVGMIGMASTIGSFIVSLSPRFRIKYGSNENKKVYGFFTLLAIGIGSTIGSPLFTLIPLNVMQYESISFGSLILATVLSVLMAKVYGDMYPISKKLGVESVGGPSFTRLACGRKSIRYFLSRVSMWISNTTLAAYSKLVFVIFDLEILPNILSQYNVESSLSFFVAYLIAIIFIGWSVINAAYERKILKSVGILQIVLVILMVGMLIFHTAYLGSISSWNLKGIFSLRPGNPILALIINTGYLYLLFFGFQEIQALEKDSFDVVNSPLPFIKRKLEKTEYFRHVMIFSVVIASVVNILYGIAVFSIHPSVNALESSAIPALYIAKNYGGSLQELIVAISFLIASITTFVPAFVAASRHLDALCGDGYLPRSLSGFSWVFTLLAIFILAVGNADFLVTITDFLVLISLGVISLSPIWINTKGIDKKVPVIVGLSCFVAGASIYLIEPGVVIAGVFAVLFTYLAFAMLELGELGSKMFISIFCLIASLFMGLFNFSLSPGFLTSLVFPASYNMYVILRAVLLVISLVEVLDIARVRYLTLRQF